MLWSVICVIFKTSSVTPNFFYVFNLVLSFSTCSQCFNKICVWEVLGANILKVDKLALELVNHPNISFVANLISALQYGTHIGYLHPHKPWASHNLISALQLPDVISGNLYKKVQMGRITGSFPPCPDLTCSVTP